MPPEDRFGPLQRFCGRRHEGAVWLACSTGPRTQTAGPRPGGPSVAWRRARQGSAWAAAGSLSEAASPRDPSALGGPGVLFHTAWPGRREASLPWGWSLLLSRKGPEKAPEAQATARQGLPTPVMADTQQRPPTCTVRRGPKLPEDERAHGRDRSDGLVPNTEQARWGFPP